MELNTSTRNGSQALVINTEEEGNDEKLYLGQEENANTIRENHKVCHHLITHIKSCFIVGLLAK